MARKESIITLEDDGESKRFKIRQMSSTQSEKFIFKLIFLIGGKAEIEKLNDIGSLLEAVSDKPYDRVQEILDALLSCVSIVHGGVETQLDPDNVDGFVMDFQTLLKLRAEAFKANNFFPRNGGSDSVESPAPVTIKRKA
jgi:hypothetical protein